MILRKLSLLTLLSVCLSSLSQTSIRLPDIISSGMVLQQQTEVKIWGKATPGSRISIHTDWTRKDISTEADADSTWFLRVTTPKASWHQHVIALRENGNATTQVVLSNVLIGEVWFCSGQSNMEMFLNGFGGCPIDGANEEIATAAEWAGRIRMANVPKTGNTEPQEWVSGCKWNVPDVNTAPWMSAAAWHFAKMLTRTLQVPVGIISCAWGGSRVEGWLPRNILESYPDIKLEEELKRGWNGRWWEYHSPMIMYNAMLHPLRHYTIKGFLWYQGESNVGRHNVHAERLKTMADLWRKEFGGTAETLPFYLAEIAPWEGYGGKDGISGALLREAQHQAAKLIGNSGCIVTNDLVKPCEAPQIHPANKRDVGYRFAYMALQKTYGIRSILGQSPEYERMEIHDKEIEVFFRHAEDGLSPWTDIVGFEIAGADGKFQPATARYHERNRSIIVSSPQVAAPKNVRYCFKNFQIGNLTNFRGLAVVPFRTDKE